MKDKLIGTLNFFELEHYNNLNNQSYKIRNLQNQVPQVIAGMRQRVEQFNGELDEPSEQRVIEFLNDIQYSLQDIFDRIYSVGKRVDEWNAQIDAMQLDPLPMPETIVGPITNIDDANGDSADFIIPDEE